MDHRLIKLEAGRGRKSAVIVHAPRALASRRGGEVDEPVLRKMAELFYQRTDFGLWPISCDVNNGPSFYWIEDVGAFFNAIRNSEGRIGDSKPSTFDPDRNCLAGAIADHITDDTEFLGDWDEYNGH